MKIHYSPYYDNGCFLGDSPRLMGEIYLGNKGLLQQLQQRAGMHIECKSEVERETDYYKAVKQVKTPAFYDKAFKSDEMGVAAKLLRWRDALVMAGWDGKCSDPQAKKVAALAEVEKTFEAFGEADAWRKVRDEYAKHNALQGVVEEIVVECPWSEVPGLIQQTLKAVQKGGTNLNQTVDGAAEPPALNTDKVTLLEFADLDQAYEWFATRKDLPADMAVINRDNLRLNHTLFTWDRPLQESSCNDANPQLLQLFKLSMSVFARPLNVQNLVSYLQLPESPVSGYLGNKLARLLISEGGFGEKSKRDDGAVRDEWEEILKGDKGKWLDPVRKSYDDRSKLKADIIAYAERFKKWIGQKLNNKDLPADLKSQLHELGTYYDSLLLALEELPSTIDNSDVEKLIRHIYRPMNIARQSAQVGSSNLISDIRSMAKGAACLLWLDCQNETPEHDPYDFLNSDEHQYLEGKGCVLPDFTEHLKRCRSERLRQLDRCQRIILVRSQYDGLDRLSEHPIVTEMRRVFQKAGLELVSAKPDDVLSKIDVTTETKSVQTLQPQKALEIGPIEYAGRKMSNSSIDKLIKTPFDYVMTYMVHMKSPADEQLATESITLGNVAHSFIEHVVGDAHGSLSEMRDLTEREFDSRLNDAIDRKGLILRQPENAATLADFSIKLKESVLSLIDIMDKKGWTPERCEVELPDGKEGVKIGAIERFGARIDFLAKHGDKYVIIDFKWSYNKKFVEWLEANTAIQLELYSRVAKEIYGADKVEGVGYYLMPKRQLVTSDFDEIPESKQIVHVNKEDTSDLFAKIENSYKFRMEELRRGHIEEGELQDFEGDTDSYYGQITPQVLLPIDIDVKPRSHTAVKQSVKVYKNVPKKTFDDNSKDPQETPTTYPILKGRLK